MWLLYALFCGSLFVCHCREAMTKYEALKHCEKQKMALPIVNSPDQNAEFKTNISLAGFQESWLMPELKDLGNWHWTSGSTEYSERDDPIIMRNQKHNCAITKGLTGRYSVDCFSVIPGYICILEDCATCKSTKCYNVTKDDFKGCILMIEEKKTFYQAITACRSRKGQLITDNDGLKQVEKTIYNEEYLIGLTRGSWRADEVFITWMNWTFEINSDGKTCAIIKSDGGWEPADCDRKHEFICVEGRMPQNSFKSSTVSESTSETPTTFQENATVVVHRFVSPLLLVAIGAGFVVLVVIVTVCVRHSLKQPVQVPMPDVSRVRNETCCHAQNKEDDYLVPTYHTDEGKAARSSTELGKSYLSLPNLLSGSEPSLPDVVGGRRSVVDGVQRTMAAQPIYSLVKREREKGIIPEESTQRSSVCGSEAIPPPLPLPLSRPPSRQPTFKLSNLTSDPDRLHSSNPQLALP